MEFFANGPARSKHTLVLAHGAGAPADAPDLVALAEGIAAAGVRVLRFEFPYMAARRTDGSQRGPDREPTLLRTWREAIEAARPPRSRLFIGGRSMGGRMASMVADEAEVAGLLCYGYPFHPPGQPDRLRTAHLAELRTPTRIFQGERDPFGVPAEVEGYTLSDAIEVVWLPDGDHSLKPRKASGFTAAGHLQTVVDLSVAFILDDSPGGVARLRLGVARDPSATRPSRSVLIGPPRR